MILKLQPRVCMLAVFAAVLLTYLPSAWYGFVSYDDYLYVYENPRVTGGVSSGNLMWAAKSCGYASNWHPLAWMSLQIDASLARTKPDATGVCSESSLRRLAAVMHAHNVLLHAANASLLFFLILLLARRLLPERAADLPVAALVALLWAIHPLRTEVVCWVSERKELTCVFFMLLSLIAYVRSRYLPSLVLFALALAAKPLAVTLPAVLFAWDWVMTGLPFRRTLERSLPFLVLSAFASRMTLAAQVGAVRIGNQFSLLDKIVMTLSAPAIYLRQTFWPSGLSAFYPTVSSVPWIELCLGVALLAGSVTVCVLWLVRRRSPVLSLLAFAVAWCHVCLVPMLGIVKVGDQPHSDRYTYWVGCGFAATVALALCRYVRDRDRLLPKTLAAVLAALVVATLARMPVWKDSYSLYADAVPKSWAQQPVVSLSRILRQRGPEGIREAEQMLRDALMQTPYREVRAEFAHLLACRIEPSAFHLRESDPAFAEMRLEARSVLKDEPAHALANEAMAIADMKEGKWESAERHLLLARPTCEEPDRIDRYLADCRKNKTAGEKESDVQK